MAIRSLYGMTKETVAAWISESEASLKRLEADRKSRKDFRETAEVLTWTQDPQALELARLFRDADEDDAVVNAHEIAEHFKGEAACLLEHMLVTSGYRRDLYTRMLVVCTYEALKTLRRSLGREYQSAIAGTLGDAGLALAREAHADVTELFRRALKGFGDVRDGIAAHREPNAERRRKLLDTFLDWELPQVALAAIDVLQPVNQLYRQHTTARVPNQLDLFRKMKALGDQLVARGVLPIKLADSGDKGSGEGPRTT